MIIDVRQQQLQQKRVPTNALPVQPQPIAGQALSPPDGSTGSRTTFPALQQPGATTQQLPTVSGDRPPGPQVNMLQPMKMPMPDYDLPKPDPYGPPPDFYGEEADPYAPEEKYYPDEEPYAPPPVEPEVPGPNILPAEDPTAPGPEWMTGGKGDPVGLENLGALIEAALGKGTAFEEAIPAMRERAEREITEKANLEASKRGIAFSSIPGGQISRGLLDTEGKLQAGLAQARDQSMQNLMQIAMGFGQQGQMSQAQMNQIAALIAQMGAGG